MGEPGENSTALNPFRYSREAIAAAFLFLASAGVVVWQASRLTVLWDVSYVLENASRMAGGDVPYRDFPFPYPPLTFAMQALIIRLFGHVYWHATFYAAIVCGVGSVLAHAVVRRLVAPKISLVLCAPLALLGIYCIFPHPFYDPDACLAVLVALLVLLIDDDNPWAGALVVVPLLVKQNIGFAFFAAVAVVALFERRWRLLSGMLLAAAAAAGAISVLFGWTNYIRWTIHYAAARRMPPLREVLSIYREWTVWWSAIALVAGCCWLRWSSRHRWAGVLLMVWPWLWILFRFLVTDDPVEPQINLLRLWPIVMVSTVMTVALSWRSGPPSSRLVPLAMLGAIHGAFLSQSTWGSTYGIWPLAVILIGLLFHFSRAPLIAAVLIAAITIHSGFGYVLANDRLSYVQWRDGEMNRSDLPELQGMRMRGPWLPQFDELVHFTDRVIPRGDGILCLPGEDLFYFATGRQPRSAVLMFDGTVNPLAPAEIASMAERRGLRWVIVKRRLQIEGNPYPEMAAMLQTLGERYGLVAKLTGYDVYALRGRRSH